MNNNIVSHPLNLSYQEYIKKNKNLTGAIIGNYIISEKLGEGAFGAVFKGINDKTK